MSSARLSTSAIAAAGLAFAGVAAAMAGATTAQAATSHRHPQTIVYTESNATAGNAVLAFDSRGRRIGSYPTGGTGAGAGLPSQGAVTVAGDRLYAVNAGSSSVSSFAILAGGGLRHLRTASSGGATPVSVAVRGEAVYVLNASSVKAFRRHGDDLVPNGIAPLHSGAAGAGDVAVAPNGRYVLVTEKASNSIDLFRVGANGRLGAAHPTASTGTTPYGFSFGQAGVAVVANAAGGVTGASTVTAYRASRDGNLTAKATRADGRTAACWLVTDPSGRTAYVMNAGDGTISTFAIAANGHLTRISAVAAAPGGHVGDAAISAGRLWILDDTGARIVSVPLRARGALGATTTVAGQLPAASSGLATSIR